MDSTKSFRWLHISDIHTVCNLEQNAMRKTFTNEIGKAVQEKKIDCILITGDFFLHGKCNQTTKSSIDCFIGELRKKADVPILYCPGNHDLNRDAVCENISTLECFNRRDVLDKMSSEDGAFPYEKNSPEYDLLTNKSFLLYDNVIQRGIVNNSLLIEPTDYPLEYNIFSGKNDTIWPVIFIGLNTALTAGQPRKIDVVKKEIEAKRKEFEDADIVNKPEAATQYKAYMKLCKELENREPCDQNRLLFISEPANRSLVENIAHLKDCARKKGIDPVFVFFGHHPITFLSQNAMGKFGLLIEDSRCEEECGAIYLCGHEHKTRITKPSLIIGGQTNAVHLLQIEVGGAFSDMSEWNIGSFSVGEIEFKGDGSVEMRNDLHIWTKVFSEDEDLSGIVSARYGIDQTPVKQYMWIKIEFEDTVRKKKQIEDSLNTIDNPIIGTTCFKKDTHFVECKTNNESSISTTKKLTRSDYSNGGSDGSQPPEKELGAQISVKSVSQTISIRDCNIRW